MLRYTYRAGTCATYHPSWVVAPARGRLSGFPRSLLPGGVWKRHPEEHATPWQSFKFCPSYHIRQTKIRPPLKHTQRARVAHCRWAVQTTVSKFTSQNSYHWGTTGSWGLHVNSNLRSLSTRQNLDFALPRVRTEAGKRRFLYDVVQNYNKLPLPMRHSTIPHFKREIAKICRPA